MEGRGRRRIPVVYYLCRNRHLEHPHFIEVPLSSPEGLYLKDVIERMNAIRGKCMAASYSWSCKRSYKNGFVWHDLSEDDLILPANGNEYVLKGSELLDQSPIERVRQTSTSPKPGNQIRPRQELGIQIPKPKSKENNSPSSSSSPLQTKNKRSNSNPNSNSNSNSDSKPVSPLSLSSPRGEEEERENSPSSLSSQSPNEPQLNPKKKPINPSIDASTQTEELNQEILKNSCEISTKSETLKRSCGVSTKSETLESLIRSEARKTNRIRVLSEEEEVFIPSLNPKLSPTSYLMQLITCGSISVKNNYDNNNKYRFISSLNNYGPSYFNMDLPSPIYGNNSMRFLTRVEDKEYFSGSIVETKMSRENDISKVPILKKSNSYNTQRGGELMEERESAESASILSCLPKTIKLITSPVWDCPRISSAGQSQRSQSQTPLGGSRRMEEGSRRDHKEEKLITIEERLTSGAKVVIQSRVPSEEGNDT